MSLHAEAANADKKLHSLNTTANHLEQIQIDTSFYRLSEIDYKIQKAVASTKTLRCNGFFRSKSVIFDYVSMYKALCIIYKPNNMTYNTISTIEIS